MVTTTTLLSQSELNTRRAADATRLAELKQAVSRAALAVFEGGGHTWTPSKSKEEKLRELDAIEADAIGVLDAVRASQMAAIRQINALGSQSGMTDAQVAEHNLHEPAIRSLAESISIQGLERELRNAAFEGNPVKSGIWARQAQQVLDRATDAGTRISPELSRELAKLMTQLAAAGATTDRRKELRDPFGEVADQARVLEQWIIEARKRRGASTFGRSYEFGTQNRTVPFRQSTEHINPTGYPELDALDKVAP